MITFAMSYKVVFMLLKCLSKSLNEKLSKLELVVKNAGSNSLYKNIKIDIINSLAYITSVNAKVCVIERLEVESDSNFSFLVEASSFIRFIKNRRMVRLRSFFPIRRTVLLYTTPLVSIAVRPLT